MTYTYKEQVDLLRDIRLRDGDYLRIDCPFCGGKNTFGIRRDNGVTAWGCFRASCSCKGHMNVGYTHAGLRFKISGETQIRASNNASSPIPVPLVSISKREDILTWLETVHSLRAYNEGMVNITYSPTEDRVMFRLPQRNLDNIRLGYIGRSLQTINGRKNAFGPKWKKYGDTTSPFMCGKGDIGVIVEDAPSACAVGIIPELTGIALLGTNLTTQHKLDLRQFKQIFVCLDPDAARKSIGLTKRLQGVSNVSTKLIKDDLKWYAPHDIKAMLCVE